MGSKLSLHLASKLVLVSFIVVGFGQGAQAQSTGKLGAPSVSAALPAPLPDPGNLFAHAGDVGRTLRFTVVGNLQGTVWGDGTYTSDSALAAAAVHAGLLKPGQAGVVSVEIVEGPATYDGAVRNGVTSLAYGAWAVAYRLVGVEPIEGPVVLPDPGNLTAYRGQDGTILTFEVTGALGSVWGDGTYTDDSQLASAAVHAGLLGDGETGEVRVEILPGQASYEGAERNGIISQDYGAWSGSYRVLPSLGSKVTGKLSN